MSNPLTIDKYPREIHNRFAEDQITFDPHLIEKYPFVPHQTEVGVVKPAFVPAYDELFTTEKISWASFSPPPHYFSQSKRFFGYQIIAHIDPESVLQFFHNALETIKDTYDETKEKFILVLLECLEELNRLLIEIRSRIHQYSKG